MTLALPYLYLAAAITFEVIGTSALKASDTFTRLVPSLVTLAAYAVSFLWRASIAFAASAMTALNNKLPRLPSSGPPTCIASA